MVLRPIWTFPHPIPLDVLCEWSNNRLMYSYNQIADCLEDGGPFGHNHPADMMDTMEDINNELLSRNFVFSNRLNALRPLGFARPGPPRLPRRAPPPMGYTHTTYVEAPAPAIPASAQGPSTVVVGDNTAGMIPTYNPDGSITYTKPGKVRVEREEDTHIRVENVQKVTQVDRYGNPIDSKSKGKRGKGSSSKKGKDSGSGRKRIEYKKEEESEEEDEEESSSEESSRGARSDEEEEESESEEEDRKKKGKKGGKGWKKKISRSKKDRKSRDRSRDRSRSRRRSRSRS